MQQHIYSVYDQAAAAYLPPFTMHNDNMAKRIFIDTINQADHAFAKNPADYTLFRLGTFDDSTGIVTSDQESLGNALTYQEK